jgi:hypothetical protein
VIAAMADRGAGLGRQCRHFSALSFLRERRGFPDCAACALGHPIRKMVTEACGDETGIIFKLPCRPGPEKAVDCPAYDPKTDAEIEADREAQRCSVEKALVMMKAAGAWRRSMVAVGEETRLWSCPVCLGLDTVEVSIALAVNGHMACRCTNCGTGFRE